MIAWLPPAGPTAPAHEAHGTLAVYDERPGLNPVIDRDPVDRRWQDLVFDRLFFRLADGRVDSFLVARAEADGDAVTVHLRPGIRFHDGRELGAIDVCASLAYVRGPTCTVVRQDTARIALAGPSAQPFAELDGYVLPAGLAALDLAEGGSFSKRPIGTGPMTAVVGKREVRLTAVPSHRPAPVAALALMESGDPLVALRTVSNGGVDVWIGVPATYAPDVATAGLTLATWGALRVAASPGVRIPLDADGQEPFLCAEGWIGR